MLSGDLIKIQALHRQGLRNVEIAPRRIGVYLTRYLRIARKIMITEPDGLPTPTHPLTLTGRRGRLSGLSERQNEAPYSTFAASVSIIMSSARMP